MIFYYGSQPQKKKKVSQPLFFLSTLKALKGGVTSSKIAISESVFSYLVSCILFGVSENVM